MRVASPEEYEAAMAWLRGWDTGISSKTIWRVMMSETPEAPDIPYDPSDFGRCYRLLQKVPSWRARLAEVVPHCKKWQPFVDAWDELTALYEEELKRPDNMAPKTYQRMRELRGEPLSEQEFARLFQPQPARKARRRR